MLVKYNPKTVPAPVGNYVQAVEVRDRPRWLHISGQVGMTLDGTLLEGFEAQCEQALKNLIACLEAAGMSLDDLVKVTILMTRQEDVPVYRAVRKRVLGGADIASTLMIVAGLVSPDFLIEIEGVAAGA
jgi:enamine deaminase RidA (YjgF/YER057c/UK114 family)